MMTEITIAVIAIAHAVMSLMIHSLHPKES